MCRSVDFEVREAVLGSDRGIMGKGVEAATSSRRAAKQTRSERRSGGSPEGEV